jgi:hypothetical protein
LSQVALCTHLGFVLTDRLEVRCFQFDRDRKTWRWPVLDGPVDTTIKVEGIPADQIDESCDAIIRISLSDTVSNVQKRHPTLFPLQASKTRRSFSSNRTVSSNGSTVSFLQNGVGKGFTRADAILQKGHTAPDYPNDP